MSSVSISIPHGVAGKKMSDFTVGILAPNAGDVEVRFNNTNTNGKNISDLDVLLLLKAIVWQIENNGPSAVNLILRVGAAPPPPLV